MANIVAPAEAINSDVQIMAVEAGYVGPAGQIAEPEEDSTNTGCAPSIRKNRESNAWIPPIHEEYPDGARKLVILFGWAGCRDRYLEKYATIYRRAGVATVRFTAPLSHIRHFSDYTPLARRVVDRVFGEEGDDWPHDVYFHVFSMNGCATFCALWDSLRETHYCSALKDRVKGIIFDSSPANVNAEQSARAISFAALPPQKHSALKRDTAKVLLHTYFSVQRAITWLRSHWDANIYERNYAFYRMLALPDLPKRQLYLYGPGDDICSQASIEEFAEAQRTRGATVQMRCFYNTEHVQHMRKNPEEYQETCLQFIDSFY